MPPETPIEPSPDVSPSLNNEEIVDPTSTISNTQVITIHRHPFGIVVLVLQVYIGIALAFGLLLFLLHQLLSADLASKAISYVGLGGLFVTMLATLFLLVSVVIYRQNKWVITDDSITQVLQTGLFRRQISELSFASIEDVTSERPGFISTIFGFGILKAETAGERSNFYFNYCPTPDKYAQIIIHAKERYVDGSPEQAHRANPQLEVPRQ